MLTLKQIAKLAQTKRYDSLLNAVLTNGRPLPLAARLRLSEPEALPAASLALGILRATELSHNVRPESASMLENLLDLQEPCGTFGSIPATALALTAISALVRQDQLFPGALDNDMREHLHTSRALAEHFLHFQQKSSPHNLLDDALSTAICLWAGQTDSAMADAVNMPELLIALELALLDGSRDAAAVLAAWGAATPEIALQAA